MVEGLAVGLWHSWSHYAVRKWNDESFYSVHCFFIQFHTSTCAMVFPNLGY